VIQKDRHQYVRRYVNLAIKLKVSPTPRLFSCWLIRAAAPVMVQHFHAPFTLVNY